MQGSGFSIQDAGFRVQGLVFRVQDSGFRIQGSGYKLGTWFRIQDSGYKVHASLQIKGHERLFLHSIVYSPFKPIFVFFFFIWKFRILHINF